MFRNAHLSSVSSIETRRSRVKRVALAAMLIVVMLLMNMQVLALVGPDLITSTDDVKNYLTGPSSVPVEVEITGISTNSHTNINEVWTNDDVLFLAIASTHNLDRVVLDKVTKNASSDLILKTKEKLPAKLAIDGQLSPSLDSLVQGNVGDARWYVFEFSFFEINIQNSSIKTLSVFSEKGVGHEIQCGLEITVPTVTINLNKTWNGGPRTPVSLQVQRRVSETSDFVNVRTPVELTTEDSNEAMSGLPYFNETLQIYQYRAVEADPGEGYTAVETLTGPVVTNVDGQTIYTYEYGVQNTYNAAPAITLDKIGTYVDTTADGVINAGDHIDYVFTITNTGDVSLKSITITDLLITVDGGPLATLAVDASDSTTFSGSYLLKQTDIDAGLFTNAATVTGYGPNNEIVTATDTDSQTLTAAPSIELTKTGVYVDSDKNGDVNPGDQITYTFAIKNTGNVTLKNITLTDLLISLNGSTIISLSPGATDSLTFTGSYTLTQGDINNGKVINSASATGSAPSGELVSDTDEDEQTFTTRALISLDKFGIYVDTNNDQMHSVGDQINYTLTVTNIGNVTLTDVVVDDPQLTVINGTRTELAPGASFTATGTYMLTQTNIENGIFINNATVTGTPPTGNDVADSDIDAKYFTQSPSITLDKTGTTIDANGDGIDNVGDYIEYSFTVTNNGNIDLEDITIKDDLVAILGGPILSLSPGASDSTTFTARYDLTWDDIETGYVENEAEAIAYFNLSAIPRSMTAMQDNQLVIRPFVTATDTDIQYFTSAPDVELIKTGTLVDGNDDGIDNVGDYIEYTFTVTNTGNVALEDIVIEDPQVTVSGVPIESLAPGAVDATSFTARYDVTQEDIDAGIFTNTAEVTAYYGPEEPMALTDIMNEIPSYVRSSVIDQSSDTQTFTQNAEIELIKTGTYNDINGDGLHNASDTILYTFTVTNAGNVTLYDVTVTDPLITVNGTTIASLAPGTTDTSTFTGAYLLTVTDIETGSFVNTATVSGTAAPLEGEDSGESVSATDTDTQTFSELTDIAISKMWVDENNVDELRPQSITVRLYRAVGDADPTEIGLLVISGTGNIWTASFNGLPVENIAGETLTYSVMEDAVAEYGTAISQTETGFSITNLYGPEEDIPLVVPTPTPTPELTPTPTPVVAENEEIPQTGQSRDYQGWIGLMLLAGAAAIVLFRRRREEGEASAE